MAKSNKAFTKMAIKGPSRSAVDLSHEKKLSGYIGQLIPIYWDDVVPSDKFRVRSEVLVRLAPMLAPVMHRIDVFVHYFYVPYRILWENAESFFTGGEDGTTTETVPTITYSSANQTRFDKSKLMDYLGIPPTAATVTQDMVLLAFPPAAYYKIYDEYYRNINLESAFDWTLTNGDNTAAFNLLSASGNCRSRNLEPDYFISALPVAQRGNAVELDLDITSNRGSISWETLAGATPAVGDVNFAGSKSMYEAGGANAISIADGTVNALSANLEITELRRAARLQEFLELANIAGGHYEDQMELFFGQPVRDSRVNKPEYLGGGRQAVQISEVTATAETLVPSTDALSQPVGAMAGRGISMGRTNQFTYQFPEHGIVMGIMSVMPRTAYYEGIEKYWLKTDRTEWLWPKFAQLGEQEVKQHEIFWDPVGSDYDDVFAYQSRYAEYKYKKSTVHGDFIDDFDYWHLARQIGSAPTFDDTFVKCENTDYDRIFAVTTGTVDKLYCQIYNDVQAIRPLPSVNVPTL